MSKHIPKLLWMLAAMLGLYFFTYGFSQKSRPAHSEPAGTEKTSETKMQAGFDIKNLSHHLLDF